jgi:hypothetical protein
MTPEERFAEYVMWVLNGIKEESLATLEGEPIEYNFSHVGAAGVPSNDTEEKILYKLQEWKAIKITDLIETTSDFEGRFFLELLQPTFDETYNQYKKLASPAMRIVNSFSSGNLPFVLFVLKGILSAVEFSVENEIKYKLQSPAGEQLMRERQLLSKLQSFDILWSYGEDGIYAIATFRDVKIDVIKEIIDEIKLRQSPPILAQQVKVVGTQEAREIKAQYGKLKLIKSSIPKEINLYYDNELLSLRKGSQTTKLLQIFVEKKRLTIDEMLSIWNNERTGGWKKEVGKHNVDYVPTIIRVLKTKLNENPEIGKHVKYERDKNSYTMSVD